MKEFIGLNIHTRITLQLLLLLLGNFSLVSDGHNLSKHDYAIASGCNVPKPIILRLEL